MKRIVALTLAGILAIGIQSPIQASTVQLYKNEILTMQPGVSAEELQKQVEELVLITGMKEDEIYEMMYKEMEEQNRLAEEEAKELAAQFGASDGASLQGGGTANYIIGPSARGDFYYTPSATAYVNHGHVGLYYSSSTIVESIYPSGVRSISANVRTVDKGAVVKSVSTTSTVKQNAASWAWTQIGQPYSLNFANNRNTGHYGAKNCSKLIWSAYLLKGNIDLDVNKGLGVYPRDVRDATQTRFIRQI